MWYDWRVTLHPGLAILDAVLTSTADISREVF
jgi:hypothetical protein